MKDTHPAIQSLIQSALGRSLGEEGYDVIDLIPIPSRGDKMVRIRTLEEVLDDFDRFSDDSGEGDTIGYLIQVKKKRSEIPAIPIQAEAMTHENPMGSSKPTLDGIYLPNGKLNVAFLQRNAELLLAAGETALARNVYRTIYQSGEGSAKALFGLARCYELEGKFDEAITHYEESITYHPLIETYQRLASLLIAQKKDQEAAELMERALGIKELNAQTRLELHKICGGCWARLENGSMWEKAETHFLQAMEMDPLDDSIQANLGALYLKLGKTQPAKHQFESAIAINPRNEKALAGLGSCFIAEGDKKSAYDAFIRALEIDLNNPTCIYHLVKCAYELKSYAPAARLLAEYVQIAPINANLLYSLAGLQFHLGRMAEAKATAEQVLKLQQTHAGASELLELIEKY
jgi:tetratricopeptide (TPR) repeat protein